MKFIYIGTKSCGGNYWHDLVIPSIQVLKQLRKQTDLFYLSFENFNCLSFNEQDWHHSKNRSSKSDDQTNNDKYRVTANITEYHNISKLIFFRIIISKLMLKRQLFHVKMSEINMFKMDEWTFLSQLSSCYAFCIYLTVLGIITPNLKSIRQFWYTYIYKSKKPKIVMLKNGHTDFLVMIIELIRFLKVPNY